MIETMDETRQGLIWMELHWYMDIGYTIYQVPTMYWRGGFNYHFNFFMLMWLS